MPLKESASRQRVPVQNAKELKACHNGGMEFSLSEVMKQCCKIGIWSIYPFL